MKIKEQFYVVKNLTTRQFVFNVNDHFDHLAPTFTRLLTSAKCFETFECAADAINDIGVFYLNKEREAATATDHPEYQVQNAQRNYEKFAKNLVICKLTRTHSLSKGVCL